MRPYGAGASEASVPLRHSSSRGLPGFAPPARSRARTEYSLEARAGSAPGGAAPRPACGSRAELGVTLRPGRRNQIDTTYLFTRLEDAASGHEVFTERITRLRWRLQFTPRFWLRMIVQHEDRDAQPAWSLMEKP